MANVTLSINDETKKKMSRHSSIKWSNVVRSIIEKKLNDFEEAERLARKSKLTPADFKLISKKIESSSRKHAKRMLHESDSGR